MSERGRDGTGEAGGDGWGRWWGGDWEGENPSKVSTAGCRKGRGLIGKEKLQ